MFADGSWGVKAKERSKRRLEYFLARARERCVPKNSLGYLGEQIAQEILKGSYRVDRSFDLLWEGKKVDVKTSKPQLFRNRKRWKFFLRRQKGKVDYFIILLLDEDRKLIGAYLIPDEVINYTNITIQINIPSKYEQYRMSLS